MKGDELYLIYQTFTKQLVKTGWQERFYSWKETIESELGVGTCMTFQYDNGLNIKFDEKENGEAKLVYWFENSETAVEVTSMEQLLELQNID